MKTSLLTLSYRKFLAGILMLFTLAGTNAMAADPIYTEFFNNNAIRGYDTVAYHTENKAVEGKAEFTAEYMGADWLFASAENQALFEADPVKYAPQYGGYCAFAVSKGSTASIEPEQFSVVDGKLYLNYNASVRKTWSEDIPGNIMKADGNWPEVLN